MYISFKSTFQTKSVVLYKDKEINSYRPRAVNIVELLPNDKADILALKRVNNSWLKEKNASPMITNVCDEFFNSRSVDNKAQHFYALTLQNENFKKLNYTQIMGVAAFSEYKSKDLENELELLSVNPKYCYQKFKRRNYKHVGSALLSFLKNKYNNKPIWIESVPCAVAFYQKNGFREVVKNASFHAMSNAFIKKIK